MEPVCDRGQKRNSVKLQREREKLLPPIRGDAAKEMITELHFGGCSQSRETEREREEVGKKWVKTWRQRCKAGWADRTESIPTVGNMVRGEIW